MFVQLLVKPASMRDMATGSAAPSAVETGGGCPQERLEEWRVLLDRHAMLSAALEKALQDRHGIGLSEFETLDRLVDANCGSYRMQDLARDSHLSQSALSRAVARLEKAGLVRRDICSDDRRGVFVCLTSDGALMHRDALPTHRGILVETWDSVGS